MGKQKSLMWMYLKSEREFFRCPFSLCPFTEILAVACTVKKWVYTLFAIYPFVKIPTWTDCYFTVLFYKCYICNIYLQVMQAYIVLNISIQDSLGFIHIYILSSSGGIKIQKPMVLAIWCYSDSWICWVKKTQIQLSSIML